MIETVNDLLPRAVRRWPDRTAFEVLDGDAYRPITFAELDRRVERVAAGLCDLGLEPGDRVLLLSDNRLEWMIADQAILAAGGVTVPRGTDAPDREILHIARHARASIALCEDAGQLETLRRVGRDLARQPRPVVLDPSFEGSDEVPGLADLEARGEDRLEEARERRRAATPDDLASIVYSSGTTGTPKGVELTHGNFASQARVLPGVVDLTEEDRVVSVLPPWHVFERTVEYASLAAGAETAYSKPDPRVLLRSFELQRPTIIACVPRLLEAIHDGIWREVERKGLLAEAVFVGFVEAAKADWEARTTLRGFVPDAGPVPPVRRLARGLVALGRRALTAPLASLGDRLLFETVREKTGGCLRTIISGGGSLPAYLDEFFHALGIPVWEGYGLTETAPVVSVRHADQDVPYTVGPPLPGTEARIVDERGRPLPPGRVGEIRVKGPGVMRGYHRAPEATARVLSEDGWLDTGDLGRRTRTGDLQITGRSKDTIVLLSGENVEPRPIEERLHESPYVHQAMLAGQDRHFLTVLIVPDREAIARVVGEPEAFPDEEWRREVESLLDGELRRLFRDARPHERPRRFIICRREFEVGEELTRTLKMRRNVIAERYREEIDAIYS